MVNLPKVQTMNLWDQAYTILKENITRRTFKPNEKLLISELVKQLGISNTPVRDAIIRLEMEGLITTVSKVGTFVNAITAEDVSHTMDTRLMLEYWVADRLSGLTVSELKDSVKSMHEIVEKSLEALNSMDLTEYMSKDYNYMFHIEYMTLGKNPKNVNIYTNLMNYRQVLSASVTETYETKRSAIEQHQLIIEAIRSGSIQDIKRTVSEHLEVSKIKLLQLIEDNGGMI